MPWHALPLLGWLNHCQRCSRCSQRVAKHANQKQQAFETSGSQHAAAAWLLGGAPASSLAPAAPVAMGRRIVSGAVDQARTGQQALPLPRLIQLLQGRHVGMQMQDGCAGKWAL